MPLPFHNESQGRCDCDRVQLLFFPKHIPVVNMPIPPPTDQFRLLFGKPVNSRVGDGNKPSSTSLFQLPDGGAVDGSDSADADETELNWFIHYEKTRFNVRRDFRCSSPKI